MLVTAMRIMLSSLCSDFLSDQSRDKSVKISSSVFRAVICSRKTLRRRKKIRQLSFPYAVSPRKCLFFKFSVFVCVYFLTNEPYLLGIIIDPVRAVRRERTLYPSGARFVSALIWSRPRGCGRRQLYR